MTENKDNNKVKNWPKTPKGYISIPLHEYKDLSDEEKESMRQNGESLENSTKRQKLPPEARTVYQIPTVTETDTSGNFSEPETGNKKNQRKKKIRFNIGAEGEEQQE